MHDQSPSHKIDRFRGWVLIALYASLAVLCLLILYALFALQQSFADRSLEYYATLAITGIAAAFNAKATATHFGVVRSESPLPPLALKPFLAVAVTLLFAGRLFGGL